MGQETHMARGWKGSQEKLTVASFIIQEGVKEERLKSKLKLDGPRANYTDRATAACLPS
jgi:hypothetical protein